MKLELNTKLELGTEIYFLNCETANVYKPCGICNNERKITITAGGKEYTIDCPECKDKYVKGDISKATQIKKYNLDVATIKSFRYETLNWAVAPKWYAYTDKCVLVDVETLTDTSICRPITLFFDKAEAAAEMKKLNKAENEKKKAFLVDIEQTESKEGETE
ncbi:MAG: hypothetical protein LBM93_10185 [Oscillospiraceae bacterium]|jgi:hypothetical protein|nr:hypothetical protein [Oscillospiraceae bacterium]